MKTTLRPWTTMTKAHGLLTGSLMMISPLLALTAMADGIPRVTSQRSARSDQAVQLARQVPVPGPLKSRFRMERDSRYQVSQSREQVMRVQVIPTNEVTRETRGPRGQYYKVRTLDQDGHPLVVEQVHGWWSGNRWFEVAQGEVGGTIEVTVSTKGMGSLASVTRSPTGKLKSAGGYGRVESALMKQAVRIASGIRQGKIIPTTFLAPALPPNPPPTADTIFRQPPYMPPVYSE
jgi:hypothetical protein